VSYSPTVKSATDKVIFTDGQLSHRQSHIHRRSTQPPTKSYSPTIKSATDKVIFTDGQLSHRQSHIHRQSNQPPTKPYSPTVNSATDKVIFTDGQISHRQSHLRHLTPSQLSYRGRNAAGKLLSADCNLATYQLRTAGIPYNGFLPLGTDVSTVAASSRRWIETFGILLVVLRLFPRADVEGETV